MNDSFEAMQFEGLTSRLRPEDAAALAVAAGVSTPALDIFVAKTQSFEHLSLMPRIWARHPGLNRAYASARLLMDRVCETVGVPPLAFADATDPGSLFEFISQAQTILGLSPVDAHPNPVRRKPRARVKTHTYSYGDYTHTYTYRAGSRGRRGDTHGHADPRTGYSPEQRRLMLPGVAANTYRKAVRSVCHLEQRTVVLAECRDREAAVAFGKSRLASRIDFDAFVADKNTAAFVSYYVARLGLRTQFTVAAQARPMDEVAEELFALLQSSATTRWDVVAAVYTPARVIAHLTDEQKAELLGVYYENMLAFGRCLDRAFDYNRDRTSMVVRRGDDSSTWNVASRAFNQARTGWLNLVTNMGLSSMLDEMLPGKVPSLIASDVAHWHTLEGDSNAADAALFATLPLPWQVLTGEAACTRQLVEEECEKLGVDPAVTGWTLPYRQDSIEQSTATPELVHGVTVGHPVLADVLRRAGVFAGAV